MTAQHVLGWVFLMPLAPLMAFMSGTCLYTAFAEPDGYLMVKGVSLWVGTGLLVAAFCAVEGWL